MFLYCSIPTSNRRPFFDAPTCRKHESGPKQGSISDDPSASFDIFLGPTSPNEMAEGMTLEAIAHHFKSFRSVLDRPNIQIFHYADMKRDLHGHTRHLASILSVDLETNQLEQIADSLQFETMQANARAKAEQSAQSSATFPDPAAFFDSASTRKWDGKLTNADLKAFDKCLAELLPEEDAHWLKHGGVLPA